MHNIPEGLAIGLVLTSRNISKLRGGIQILCRCYLFNLYMHMCLLVNNVTNLTYVYDCSTVGNIYIYASTNNGSMCISMY